MIRRLRSVARGESGTTGVGELIGVQGNTQALRACGIEEARRLFGREADTLAERIDSVGTPSASKRSTRRFAIANSVSALAERVARTVERMPPPARASSSYVAPSRRISNSRARSPA